MAKGGARVSRTRVVGIALLVGLLVGCAAPGGGSRAPAAAAVPAAGSSAVGSTPAAPAPPASAATPAPRVAMRYGLNTTTINAAPLWVARLCN